MRRSFTRSIACAFAVATGVLVVACDEDLIDDATFRAWCNDSLCNWTVETGSVRKAPTWHAKDYAVELVDTPTVISQTTSKMATCIEFTTVADIEPSAQLTLGLDFNRDGTVDYEQPIAATNFHESKTQITAPSRYDGIRFVVSKRGAGHAVLAQMRARAVEDKNCAAPAVELHDLSLGTPCSDRNACRSGVCCGGICADCCSEDTNTVACANRGTCETRVAFSMGTDFRAAMPNQCNPGAGDRRSGAECVANTDCASGACDGAVVLAFDIDQHVDGGNPPCEAHLDPLPGSEETCIVRSVRGGRCR